LRKALLWAFQQATTTIAPLEQPLR